MALKGTKIVTVEILQDINYAFLAKYLDFKVYIDLNELSWKKPIPEKELPKVGDKIEILVTRQFDKQEYHMDCEYIGSVRAMTPEQDPWYDPLVYKLGDEFLGTIEKIMPYGSWATHPRGAAVRLVEDVSKIGLELNSKVNIRIKAIWPYKSIEGEIVK